MQKIEDFLKQCVRNENIAKLNLVTHEKKIDELTNKFVIYIRELQKWNKTYNLTSIENEREIVVKHFIDSLLYLYYIPETPLNIADVGSGAGFPGVPIALVRAYLKVTLIEPSWKKCAFLKNIKRKLELKNIEIIQAKAEEVNQKFDVIISRAVWSIKDFIKNCYHLLKKEGYFLISKSVKLQEELKDLPKGFKIEFKEFTLPDVSVSFKVLKRFIIKIEKCES